MKTTTMAVFVAAASAAVSLLSLSVASADEAAPAAAMPAVDPVDAQAAENRAITTCMWCHGPQGHSISPIYPALAGQKAWYVLAQLQAFKAETRADPYARGMMWGMSAQLDDTAMNALADYYSKQTPFASPPAPFSHAAAEIEHGKSVYSEGDAAHGVPPCAACHGPDASGSDQFPRLAGQHASYLLKQLRALHSGARVSVVMNGVAAPLQEPEMKAVSLYLESLH